MAAGGSDSTDRVMIVIGKTGTGKSATCNSLLGLADEFEEGVGGCSMTTSCKLAKRTVTTERTLTIIDTPGTMDAKDTPKALKKLSDAVNQSPNGIDAFLVILRCDVRATEDEIKAAEQAIDTFGPECYKRAILVFTHGNEYDNDEHAFSEVLGRIREGIPRLEFLLSKFDNRWVLIDNGKRKKNKLQKRDEISEMKEKRKQDVRDRQVTCLMRLVDQVAALNPRRYKKEDQQQLVLKQKEELQLAVQALQQNGEPKQQNGEPMQQTGEAMQLMVQSQMEMMMHIMGMQLRAHELGDARQERLLERLMDAHQRDRELQQERELQHMQFEMKLHEDRNSCAIQ